MKMKIRYGLMIVLIYISTTLFGSDIAPKPKKLKSEAESALNEGNHYLAIENVITSYSIHYTKLYDQD